MLKLLSESATVRRRIVWGVFRVPNDPGKATVVVSGPVRLVIEAAIMGLAVWCLAAAGQTTLAWGMGIAVVVNYALDV